jgi:hypothetical protein
MFFQKERLIAIILNAYEDNQSTKVSSKQAADTEAKPSETTSIVREEFKRRIASGLEVLARREAVQERELRNQSKSSSDDSSDATVAAKSSPVTSSVSTKRYRTPTPYLTVKDIKEDNPNDTITTAIAEESEHEEISEEEEVIEIDEDSDDNTNAELAFATNQQQAELEQLAIDYSNEVEDNKYIEVIRTLIKSYLEIQSNDLVYSAYKFLLEILPVGLSQAEADSERQSVHQVYVEFKRKKAIAEAQSQFRQIFPQSPHELFELHRTTDRTKTKTVDRLKFTNQLILAIDQQSPDFFSYRLRIGLDCADESAYKILQREFIAFLIDEIFTQAAWPVVGVRPSVLWLLGLPTNWTLKKATQVGLSRAADQDLHSQLYQNNDARQYSQKFDDFWVEHFDFLQLSQSYPPEPAFVCRTPPTGISTASPIRLAPGGRRGYSFHPPRTLQTRQEAFNFSPYATPHQGIHRPSPTRPNKSKKRPPTTSYKPSKP